jgi:hypothetical protein
VLDGGVVVCRFDPGAGTISYLFPDDFAPVVAFTDVPADPPLFPAVVASFGTSFSFL